MKAKLSLYLTYEGSDANEATIKSVLQSMVEHAADRGLLTDDLDLTVEESTFAIEITDK